MEKTCPRCGKVVVVSAEELTMHEGVVVCPQCLAVFGLDGVVRTKSQPCAVRTLQPEPQPDPEPQPQDPHPSFGFCHECGKPLPAGIKFCPYCGVSLNAPFEYPSPEPSPSPMATQPVAEESAAKRQLPSAAKWAPVFPSYHPDRRKWGSGPASARARFAAFVMILLLLALLVFIIYQGILISD